MVESIKKPSFSTFRSLLVKNYIFISMVGGIFFQCNLLPALDKSVLDISAITVLRVLGSQGESSGSTSENIPSISPAPGHYDAPQYISISTSNSNAIIYFTTDGTDPTTESTVYSEPIHIWWLAGAEIRAKAFDAGRESEVVVANYSYPLLKSGHTDCYTDSALDTCPVVGFPLQDGDVQAGVESIYEGPNPHVSFAGDYTTTDSATGLVWRSCSQGLSGNACNIGAADNLVWQDALDSCILLNQDNAGNGYAGRTDWRLPTLLELKTIMDKGLPQPAIDSNAFPSPQNSYWTSDTYSINPSNSWYVGSGYSANLTQAQNNTHSAYCVAGEVPVRRHVFEDNGDGTISDRTTGLLWQKCTSDQNAADCSGGTTSAINWGAALNFCNDLNLAGRSDWRLPNTEELFSIVDFTKATSPLIREEYFPNTISEFYWSSTSRANPASAIIISFSIGRLSQNAKSTNSYYMRCVTNE